MPSRASSYPPTDRPGLIDKANEAWPVYGDDEIAAVTEVLKSGRVNQWAGDRVTAFETAFAARCEMPHAVAVANGSLALELALRALGIGPGDEVIVTSRSFIASASCVSLVGATPVFADVDPNSQNITPKTIAPLIGPKTKAVIPVHLAGWPCDMPAIMALAETSDLLVIEDCAQAVGAHITGRPVGSFGHAATFSFCQDKIISTGGEGGMALFRDASALARAWSHKDHGKNKKAIKAADRGSAFKWVHDSIGTNWRLTEMQAAIGLAQLPKLEQWIGLRQRNAEIWKKSLARLACLRIPTPATDVGHAYYKFYAFLIPEQLIPSIERADVLQTLGAEGIRVFTGSCPEIYREEAFANLAVETRPVAHELGKWSLMFEAHPTLDPQGLKETADKVTDIIARFER
jgi:dTDP-4-amino-4,6-dideoxygalactose transaminase